MLRVDLDQGLEESTRKSSVFLPRVFPTKNLHPQLLFLFSEPFLGPQL